MHAVTMGLLKTTDVFVTNNTHPSDEDEQIVHVLVGAHKEPQNVHRES